MTRNSKGKGRLNFCSKLVWFLSKSLVFLVTFETHAANVYINPRLQEK